MIITKRSCLGEAGDLNSFRMILRGENEQSSIISDSVGPSEYGKCKNVASPVQDHPKSGRIYFDSVKVRGVEFSYPYTTQTLLIEERAV